MGDIVRYGSDNGELILFDDSLEAGFNPIFAILCLKDLMVLTVFPKQKRKKLEEFDLCYTDNYLVQ